MSHDDGKIRSDYSLVPSAIGLGSALAVWMSGGDWPRGVTHKRKREMPGMAERLGDEVLSLIEQIVPAAAELEDHRVLIGWCLIIGLALIVSWSLSGIARR
jgi:hypothetical protein